MSAFSQEIVTDGRQEKQKLLTTLGDINGLISQRIQREAQSGRMGIEITDPVLSRYADQQVEPIKRFWRMARDGYRWQLRMDRLKECKGINPQRLVAATIPGAKEPKKPQYDLSLYLKAFGEETLPQELTTVTTEPDLALFQKAFAKDNSEEPRLVDPTETPSYYLYSHILTTLRRLQQLRVVNLQGLAVEEAQSLGWLANSPSYWTEDVRPDTIWENMRVIEIGMMHAIFSRGSVWDFDEVKKAAHFFAIGSGIAQRSLNAQRPN